MSFVPEIEDAVRDRFLSMVSRFMGAKLVLSEGAPSPKSAIVSEAPIYSYGYYNCRALILVQGRRAGLSQMTPDADVGAFLKFMLKSFERGEVGAYIVEARMKYSMDLESVCRAYGVKVLGRFFRTDPSCSQCVLVLPKRKEVRVNGRERPKIVNWSIFS